MGHTIFFAIFINLIFHQPLVRAACDYASLNTDLNACVATASEVSTTKWAFPVGSIAEQATICTEVKLAALRNCTENIFIVCQSDAKSKKMFGDDGVNVANAYTNWCANGWFTEATSCMSSNNNDADRNKYAAAETAFTSAVVALNNAASATEICGLATTLVYTAYYDLLTEKCDVSTHRQVWRDFYDTILETYVCQSCTSAAAIQNPNLNRGLNLVSVVVFLFSYYSCI